MTITQWEYALALDKYRHFGRAAKACHVAQPTLSMQLQKLEEELDVILFDRSKNPILPTGEGELLLKQARVLLREYRKIPELIKEMSGTLSGSLKLAIIPTLTPYLVPLFVNEFSDQFPDVELSIEEYTTEEIIRLLSEDAIDVACLATPLKEDLLIERALFYEPFHLYVSPYHKLYEKKEVKESELELEDLWLLTEGHCFRNQVLRFCKFNSNQRVAKERLSFESGSLETLKNMVDRVGGYTLLPEMAVNLLSENDKKNIRPFLDPIPTREVSLVHSRSFLKERLIVALEKTILNNIPKNLRSYKGQVLDIN